MDISFKALLNKSEEPVKLAPAIDEKTQGSEITMQEFLDFLKTAYQVNDSPEGLLQQDGMIEAVDWLKLKQSELVRPRAVACQTESKSSLSDEKKDPMKKKSDTQASNGDPAEDVKRKLSDVLSEGLLDSVLNYMVPSNPASQPTSRRSSQAKLSDKASIISGSEKSIGRRKSTDISSIAAKSSLARVDINDEDYENLGIVSEPQESITSPKGNQIVFMGFFLAEVYSSDVIIHVCDEVKSQKKDFVCNQKLLVEKMGYFAEVTAGQSLEDMDISVHCDIGIFEWLMLWVKKETQSAAEAPELDPQCVIPVLVSAAFLQMEPLLEECLLYCHRFMNDILRTSTNLSCLNDAVMTRLAAMYTNAEVEAIKDRKDKIQSRLYCKLIQSLCEPEAESVRGHWNSLARIFRCARCKQLVSPSVGPEIPCVSSCMRLLCDGSVIFEHVRDASWNINEYVEGLHKNLRTWRKVYWRLWGDAHFLYCTICKRFFPAHQIGWCRFHPDPPQFFTVDAQRAPLPVGRYPCCGERAYRFQLLEGESGCQFREHSPCTDSVRDASVLSMLETYRVLIEEEAPKLMFPERLTRLVVKASGDADGCDGKNDGTQHFWWEGLEIIPPRPKLGLLGAFGDASVVQSSPEPPAEEPTDEDYSSSNESESSSSSSMSDRRSEESFHPSVNDTPAVPRKRGPKKRDSRLWQHNLSARSNQDIQRAYEESALKHLASVLGRRSFLTSDARISSKAWPRHITPHGGVWVRLENEWRERNNLPQQQKMRSLYTSGKARLKTARLN